jgi:tRNA U34 5-methylaminomethyl-2-thiouridine-forming methyltransferase MnmC
MYVLCTLVYNMKREVIITKDGSSTVAIPDMQVSYHSIHGAIQESVHVFIEAGLHQAYTLFPDTILHVFEMGFGTGLNALLTAMEAKKQHPIHYTSVEMHPLVADEVKVLNYGEVLDAQTVLEQLHQAPWGQPVTIHPFFTIEKQQVDLAHFTASQPVHVIYYDAFAPSAQPELWTTEVFQQLYTMLVPGGVLVTYCSKGDVRRAMQAAGFIVTKIPGPPGKREMLRAEKQSAQPAHAPGP